jgi:hypothetical protein
MFMLLLPAPASVSTPSSPLIVMLAQFLAPEIVTVKLPVPTLELASKKTSSDEVGAVDPPAPPLVEDQLVVVVPHVPVPPTQ